jgi:hypothetical protein
MIPPAVIVLTAKPCIDWDDTAGHALSLLPRR